MHCNTYKKNKENVSLGACTDHARALMQNMNVRRGVGDLILVYKRVANLASHTSRVSELLEQVRACVCTRYFACCACTTLPSTCSREHQLRPQSPECVTKEGEGSVT